MRITLLLTACALLSSCATTNQAALTSQSLVGTWRCAPVTMHGPNFDLVATSEITNGADNTYTELTTSVFTPHGKAPITSTDRSFGTWRLDGDVITTDVREAEFLSSSDPSISIERGQKALEAQLNKKSTYQSRVLEFTGNTLRRIPVNSMYKEAVVESSCERV
jgi:hypothetical protein